MTVLTVQRCTEQLLHMRLSWEPRMSRTETLTVLGFASAAPWYLQTPGLGFLVDLPAATWHISSHPRWPQEDEE